MNRVITVGASLLLCLLVAGCSAADEVETHADDLDHALSLYPGSGVIGIAMPEGLADGHNWNGMFGSFMPCVAQGDGPIEIADVSWSSSAGLEPVSVDVGVRTFTVGELNAIGSAYGTLEDPSLRGYEPIDDKFTAMTVTRRCRVEGDPPISGSIDEIVFGVTGTSDGAHLRDIRFTYLTPDGREHVVTNGWDFYLCGPAVPEDVGCR